MKNREDSGELRAWISRLESHKEHITTVRHWDEYARIHGLPTSVSIIYRFGSWNEFKKRMGLASNKRGPYTKDTLLSIARQNKSHFTSKRDWNRYAKEKGLPIDITFINAFGSWNQVKALLGIEPTKTSRPPDYSKQDILKMLDKHGVNFENRSQWDTYAKENSLPTYKTLLNYVTWDEIQSFSKRTKQRNFTEKNLIEIVHVHQHIFSEASIQQWNKYAKERSLPSSSVFLRVFGTWKSAKAKLKNDK